MGLQHLYLFYFSWFLFQEPSRVEKLMGTDEHIGCAMGGLIVYTRTLLEHARVKSQVMSLFGSISIFRLVNLEHFRKYLLILICFFGCSNLQISQPEDWQRDHQLSCSPCKGLFARLDYLVHQIVCHLYLVIGQVFYLLILICLLGCLNLHIIQPEVWQPGHQLSCFPCKGLFSLLEYLVHQIVCNLYLVIGQVFLHFHNVCFNFFLQVTVTDQALLRVSWPLYMQCLVSLVVSIMFY